MREMLSDEARCREFPTVTELMFNGGFYQIEAGSLQLWTDQTLAPPYNLITRAIVNRAAQPMVPVYPELPDGRYEIWLAAWPVQMGAMISPPVVPSLPVQGGRAIEED